ncbi:hypothetical protein HOLleu_04466 [Holothuria leucospilota]|uniref:Uncharacterized protein n=1 Tax=Holothuria leucospilota TaxID=206669 RepID=A0A9Q1HKU3_HOLLE|nr:hypothetical protein HOLleu_04466 [Holothuria leucospilota]
MVTREQRALKLCKFLRVGTNLPECLETISQSQSFVLILGERSIPEQTFVVLESQTVTGISLLQAVDICFKLFLFVGCQVYACMGMLKDLEFLPEIYLLTCSVAIKIFSTGNYVIIWVFDG